MEFLNRFIKPGGKTGWNAVDASADGLLGVSVAAPEAAGGPPAVLSCGAVPGAELNAEALGQLSAALTAQDNPWVVALNRKNYKILVAEEPAVKPDEMSQSVRWSINAMIDYPVSEASIAWMKIPTEKLLPNRPPHIYVVAARKEIVDACQEAFRQAKRPLRAVDIQETAHRNIAALAARPGEGVALLAVSKRGVQLTVTFQGELYLDRHVDEAVFGGLDEAATERARERVVLQVQRSLDFVSRMLPFIDISRVVLAPMPEGSDLPERFAENLPMPVEPLDLASVFDFSRTPELQQQELQAEYLVALGAALRFMGKAA